MRLAGPGGLLQPLATSDGETLTYGHGADGSLVMSRAWTGLVKGTLTYTHDDFFRVASRSVNGGTPLALVYHADGLFVGTSGLVGFTVTRDYQDRNRLVTGAQLGNVTDTYTYNGFGELKTYAVTTDSTTIYQLQIDTRDGLGRIASASEQLGTTTHSWSFPAC